MPQPYYRSTYFLEVLSDEPVPDMTEAELAEACTTGPYSCKMTRVLVNDEVTPLEMRTRLISQGSDPGFLIRPEDMP